MRLGHGRAAPSAGAWLALLAGGLQAYLKSVADFFVTTGNIPKALDSYDGVVDASYLQAASKL